MVFQYSQNWAIKLCYKSYTKRENKDSYPLNIKRPCFLLTIKISYFLFFRSVKISQSIIT